MIDDRVVENPSRLFLIPILVYLAQPLSKAQNDNTRTHSRSIRYLANPRSILKLVASLFILVRDFSLHCHS